MIARMIPFGVDEEHGPDSFCAALTGLDHAVLVGNFHGDIFDQGKLTFHVLHTAEFNLLFDPFAARRCGCKGRRLKDPPALCWLWQIFLPMKQR